jgi:hypothetical protein
MGAAGLDRGRADRGIAMTPLGKQMARAAGFLEPSDRMSQATTQTCNVPGEFFGMKIVTSPLMPEGYAALVNQHGALILPPNGKSYYLDFHVGRAFP